MRAACPEGGSRIIKRRRPAVPCVFSRKAEPHLVKAGYSFFRFEKNTLKVSDLSEKLEDVRQRLHVGLSLAGFRRSGSSTFNRSNIVDQKQKNRQGVNETAPLLH